MIANNGSQSPQASTVPEERTNTNNVPQLVSLITTKIRQKSSCPVIPLIIPHHDQKSKTDTSGWKYCWGNPVPNLQRQVNKETADAHMLLCEIAKLRLAILGWTMWCVRKRKRKTRGTNTSTHETPHPQIWAFMKWIETLDLVRDKNSLLDQECNDTGQVGESPIGSC